MQNNPECLGIAIGLVGKLKIHQDLIQRLVRRMEWEKRSYLDNQETITANLILQILVRQCERIGELPDRYLENHGIYRIQSIVTVPITQDNEALASLGLKPCPKHQSFQGKIFWTKMLFLMNL